MRRAPSRSVRELELSALRDRYAADHLTLEEFEDQVAEVLEHRPAEPTPETIQYAERWEIHIHDAPPGHALHIHLP